MQMEYVSEIARNIFYQICSNKDKWMKYLCGFWRVCENFSVNRIFWVFYDKILITGSLILWQEKRNQYIEFK